MLSIDIEQQPYTIIPTLLGSDFGALGHLSSQNDVIMSWWRLTATSNCFPHPYQTYKVFEHIDMLSMGIQQQPYTVLPNLLGSDFVVLGHLWSQNDMITSCLRLTATSNCFPHPSQTFTKCLSTLICCPQAYGSSHMQLSTLYLAQISGFWVTCYIMVEANSHLKLLPASILDIAYCLSTLICFP